MSTSDDGLVHLPISVVLAIWNLSFQRCQGHVLFPLKNTVVNKNKAADLGYM
jgi:hypothetical protein